MKLIKKLLAAAALAGAIAAPVQAVPIYSVGGVTWDAGSPIDFSSFSIAIRQFIDPTTGMLSGFGSITTINQTGQSTFCPTCELTFQYGGFTPGVAGVLPTTPGQSIPYSGGFVNVYVGTNTGPLSIPNSGVDPLTLSTANTGDGQVWLSMVGHNLGGVSLNGTVQGTTNITGLTGLGLLDVTGGLAASYFNTNTKNDGADWTFSTSFTSLINGVLDAVGTGNFASKSLIQQVPEPASLSLVGLALFAAGVAHRRSQKKRKS